MGGEGEPVRVKEIAKSGKFNSSHDEYNFYTENFILPWENVFFHFSGNLSL